MRSSTSLRLGTVTVLAAALLTPLASADAATTGDDGVTAFAARQPSWGPCEGLDAPDFRCAAVKVPLG